MTDVNASSSDYTQLQYAESLYAKHDYSEAARILEKLLANSDVPHGTTDARLLLARSYFHSAQLSKAEQQARAVLDAQPTEGYAALLLGRTLQRQSRHDEARNFLEMAKVWGLSS
ncbi:MAG: tetratricopeptide repeat protein [Allobranchiibius sp.]